MRQSRAAVRVCSVAGAALGLIVVGSACGQDSLSPAPGLPGDAVDAYGTGASAQVLSYVVDLTPKTSSWGGRFALGPIVKASKSNAGGYFDHLIASQAISTRFASASTPFAATSYAQWSPASPVGTGANPLVNLAPGTFAGVGRVGPQLGLSMLEFGSGLDGAFGNGDDENNIIAARASFFVRQPNRLFVTRTVGLVNKSSAAALGTASFGTGGVDEFGSAHVYADNFGMTTPQRLSQRNLVRLNAPLRSAGLVNTVAQAGAGDPGATTFVRVSSTSMVVPAMLSRSTPGSAARPVAITTDFASQFISESALNTTTSVAMPAGSPRGSVTVIPQTFAPLTNASTIATGTTLVRTDANAKTRGIQLLGLSSSGQFTLAQQVVLPTTASLIIDPTDNFAPGTTFSPISNHEFTNYQSQASFRGGLGQVAGVVLPSGDLLVAGLVAATGGGSSVPQSEDNYLAVARVPASGASSQWVVAAHTGSSSGAGGGTSKVILGRNPAGQLVPIGRLARYTEVFGSATTGPSISSPAMDRAGNIYFMSTVSLDTLSGNPNLTTALVRGNRNDATGAYQLEVITTLGDVFAGANSGVNYQIQFMGIADADSVDSGSIFPGNIVQDSVPGTSASASSMYGSVASLGGLAFRAKVVYDVNGDGAFADPSGAGGGSNSPDQAYNVVMLLMPQIAIGDYNRDGVKSVQDIFDFLAAWFGGAGDWNGDGVVSVQDIFDFLADWFAV
jgi:hypothetical protein